MQNISKKFKTNGFTLIELIVVIAVLGILAAILIPTLLNVVEDSKKGVLETNCRGIVSFVQASSIKFDKDHLFLKSRDSKKPDYESRLYLSQYIEEYFETTGYGTTNFGIVNPYSRKTGVLNWNTYKLSGFYTQQAVVISNNSDLKYSSTKLTTANGKKYLMGSIIIYLSNGDNTIEIYYIDKDGKKSSAVYRADSIG